MVVVSEFQKIGVGLSGFGIFFLLFGVLLYFDSVLLAFGNILFLTGLAFIIGLRRTAHFFFQRHKLRASSFFLGGVALVVLRWPRIGMLVESYGFVLLFNYLITQEAAPLWCKSSHNESNTVKYVNTTIQV